MKPKAPKKKDIKPTAKSGEVRETESLDMQYNKSGDIFLNLFHDIYEDMIKWSEDNCKYTYIGNKNGLPIYRIDIK